MKKIMIFFAVNTVVAGTFMITINLLARTALIKSDGFSGTQPG